MCNSCIPTPTMPVQWEVEKTWDKRNRLHREHKAIRFGMDTGVRIHETPHDGSMPTVAVFTPNKGFAGYFDNVSMAKVAVRTLFTTGTLPIESS